MAGSWVRTLVVLEPDAPGLEGRADLRVPVGTRAQVHETPDANGGYFSIAIGTNLYDVSAAEIAVEDDAQQGIVGDAMKLPSPSLCAVCSAHSTFRCSRCRAAEYCGRACQAADWKRHRLLCTGVPSVQPAARAAPMASSACDKSAYDAHERAWLVAAQSWLNALRDADRAGLEAALSEFGEALAAEPPASSTAAHAELLARRHLFYGLLLSDANESAALAGGQGSARKSGERRAAALAHLRRAAELAPTDPDVLLELCLALEQDDAHAEARARARAAIARGVLWRDEWQRPGTMVRALDAAEPRGVWEASEFAWLEQLEAHAAQISAELSELGPAHGTAWQPVGGSHRPMGRHDGSVVASGGWREIVLLGRGASNLAPRTVELLRANAPDAVSLCERGAGEVIVSALAPHTHIRAHCAPSNMRLTAHLGLQVPPAGSGRCELRVGARTLRWAEGRALVFDDSFEHEVFNLTSHTRVVLLIRFWHPALSSEAARDEAMREAERCARYGERLRHIPPLGMGCGRLWRLVCGFEACASCGRVPDGGVSLVFGGASGHDAAVVGICACGGVCRPDG